MSQLFRNIYCNFFPLVLHWFLLRELVQPATSLTIRRSWLREFPPMPLFDFVFRKRRFLRPQKNAVVPCERREIFLGKYRKNRSSRWILRITFKIYIRENILVHFLLIDIDREPRVRKFQSTGTDLFGNYSNNIKLILN